MEAIRKSADDFNRLVKPIASVELHSDFKTVEGITDDEVTILLDRLSGIDAWCIHKNGIRGVGSRMQRTYKYFRTFTIRKRIQSGNETEYAKRKRAIEKGWLYPLLTVQAYATIDGSELRGFAFAKTQDILAAIDNGLAEPTLGRTGAGLNGQAQFVIVQWDVMKNAGYWLHEHCGIGND